MKFNNKSEAHQALGITAKALALCHTLDQKVLLYKTRHKKLALMWHPDKNPDRVDLAKKKFMCIQSAYYTLLEPIATERAEAEFCAYFPENSAPDFFNEFDIVNDGLVDLRLEIMIHEEYETLSLHFSRLETQYQKTAFAQKYADFVAIARLIAANQARLSDQRYKQFLERHQGFTYKMMYFLRSNLLTLFGEELLDDFAYREAIALGRWRTVLAYRKLLNPVKLLAAILLTLMAPLKASFFHSQVLMTNQLERLKRYLTSKQASSEQVGDAVKAMVILGLCFFLPSVIFFAVPDFYLALMCIPLFSRLILVISCPVNQVVRPILKALGLQDALGPYMPFVAPLVCLAVGAGLALLFSTVSLSLTPVLEATICLCSLYICYALARLMHAMFKVSPATGVFTTGILLISLFMNIFTPIGTTMATVSLIKHTFLVASHALLYYSILKFMDQAGQFVNSIRENLSMPTQPVNERFKHVVNEVIKSTAYSEAYFDTRSDAPPVKSEQRTFWGQTQSFFGFQSKPDVQILFEQPLQALCYK